MILTTPNQPESNSLADYFLPTKQWDFSSIDNYRHYQLKIFIPQKPITAKLPACIFLDGNAIAAEIVRHPSLYANFNTILITLGYQGSKEIFTTQRCFDYTPPVNYPLPTMAEKTRQLVGGGADIFLHLISEQILPELTQSLPLDKTKLTLFGHSLGGVFSLYCLFYYPQLFSHYVASDPSFWWNNGYLTKLPELTTKLHANQQQPKRLDLMVGESANMLAANKPYKLRPGISLELAQQIRLERTCVSPDAAVDFYNRLKRQPQLAHLSICFEYHPDILHGPLMFLSAQRALKFATSC